MSWKIYIIETEDNTYYTGITTNIERRLAEHFNRKKGAKYFSISKPKKLVYIEEVQNRSLATKREIQIKKLTKNEKIKLINSKLLQF